jgi:hypothetical protein
MFINRKQEDEPQENVVKSKVWHYAELVTTLALLTQIAGVFCFFKFFFKISPDFSPPREWDYYVKQIHSSFYFLVGSICLFFSIVYFYYNVTTEERNTYGFYILVPAVTLILGISSLFLAWVEPTYINVIFGPGLLVLLLYLFWRGSEL